MTSRISTPTCIASDCVTSEYGSFSSSANPVSDSDLYWPYPCVVSTIKLDGKRSVIAVFPSPLMESSASGRDTDFASPNTINTVYCDFLFHELVPPTINALMITEMIIRPSAARNFVDVAVRVRERTSALFNGDAG